MPIVHKCHLCSSRKHCTFETSWEDWQLVFLPTKLHTLALYISHQKSEEDQRLMDVIAEIEANHKLEVEDLNLQLSKVREQNEGLDQQLVATQVAIDFDRKQFKQECLEEFEEAYKEQAQEIMDQVEDLEAERDDLKKRVSGKHRRKLC